MPKYKGSERRKYVRSKTIFPILFQVISKDRKKILSELYQGFTKDISASGMRVRVNNARASLVELIKSDRNHKLLLSIEMPFFIKPVKAVGNVTRVEKIIKDGLKIYLFSIEYEDILPQHQRRIIKRVKLMRDIPKITAVFIFGLIFALSIILFHDLKLKDRTSGLIENLNECGKKEVELNFALKRYSGVQLELNKKLERSDKNLNILTQNIILLNETESKEREELKKRLEELLANRNELQISLDEAENKNESLKHSLNKIKEMKKTMEDKIFEIMYNYIKLLQDNHTGLIPSFRGDSDFSDFAFTYDQALAINLFILNKEYKRAKSILDFYKNKAKRNNNVFYNAYFYVNGKTAEYTAHVGPNVFVGLAAMQYTKDRKSKKYLPLAKDIADWMIELQSENEKGGIKGADNIEWISTEHNLAAYAFFSRLYEVTKDKKYKEARDKTLEWIVNSAYNKGLHVFNRGENDARLATDANVLSILAVGPEDLYQKKIDPEKILNYIEKRCLVEVEYERPDDTKILVKGFDFTDYKIVRRQPVISCEWTAQAIVAYKIMSDYFEKTGNLDKAQAYKEKADYYMIELQKVAIIKGGLIKKKGIGMPSLIMALPYASQEYIDTGHGWITPKGKDTTSMAGTIYLIFSHKGFNYFNFEIVD